MPANLIFDVDGTLVDTNELHVAAWQDAFRAFHIVLSDDAVRSQIGKGGDQLLPSLLAPDILEQKGAAIERLRGEIFRRSYLSRSRAFPGVRDLFLRIKERGQKVVLASSGKRAEVEHHIAAARIGDLVAGFTSADDAEHSKPAPDIFAAALELFPAQAPAVVVGDTPYDAQAARALKLPVVGLLCGGFPRDSLVESGCTAIYDNPMHLLSEYDRSPLAKAEAHAL